MTDPTSYEGMIGRAMLGGDDEVEKQFRRMDCKLYASNKMVCECGAIHDQKKIQLLADPSQRIKAVCCLACRQNAMAALGKVGNMSALTGWTWKHWNGIDPVVSES